MTGGAWPHPDDRLERHYRRLLLAYPGAYRRRHGTEMVTTLLEMAGPARRPAVRDAWHLVVSGIRQRFRLPARPLALPAAALAAVTLGVFGAAAGSWAGEQTFAGLPSETVARHLLATVVDDPVELGPPWAAAQRVGDPTGADRVHLRVSPGAQAPGPEPTWTVEQTRDRLTAAGWTIREFTVGPLEREPLPAILADDPEHRFAHLRRVAYLTAERDGLVLRGTATDSIGGVTVDRDPEARTYSLGLGGDVFARRTGAYLPLVVAGGLLGALAGWLLVAGVAYRLRGGPPARQRLTVLLAGSALLAAALPVFATIRNATLLARHLTDLREPVHTLHAALTPGQYFATMPAWLIPACAVMTAVLTAAAILAARTARTADGDLVAPAG